MSVQKYRTHSGALRYRTRYYDHGGAERSKTFRTKRDAQAFDAIVAVKKTRGDLLPIPLEGDLTLREGAASWWPSRAARRGPRTVVVH